MRYISHRGNLYAPDSKVENTLSQIKRVIEMEYDCEIDLWRFGGNLFLGHDEPQYSVEIDFLEKYKEHLWIHCKNIEALLWCKDTQIHHLNFFWHQEDDVTLTSLGYIWAYPGLQPIKNSIAVMPEINNESELKSCFGICSDRIALYKNEYGKI